MKNNLRKLINQSPFTFIEFARLCYPELKNNPEQTLHTRIYRACENKSSIKFSEAKKFCDLLECKLTDIYKI